MSELETKTETEDLTDELSDQALDREGEPWLMSLHSNTR